MAFWRRLLAGSDWAHLLALASPSFFEVVSARELSARARELVRNWFDRPRYLQEVAALAATMARYDVGVDVVASSPNRSVVPFRSEVLSMGECPAAANGDALLRVFFLQIATQETVFLDLRASRFCRSTVTDRVVFRPLPLWTHWQSDFVLGLRQLYQGFYQGNSALFAQATRALGVSAANDVFERAFGGEKRQAWRCSLAEFRDTFQEVFVRCRDAKTPFHPDFVTLGIMLATLYDHLETLGGVYDVARAHQVAQRLCDSG